MARSANFKNRALAGALLVNVKFIIKTTSLPQSGNESPQKGRSGGVEADCVNTKATNNILKVLYYFVF
jgi:hypothetical protein